MAETPKKFVESSSKCFTCSSLCTVNEKIFIFGKNAANFAEIIQSAANININCSDNRELSGCYDLKMESPTKNCFSSVLETLERKLWNRCDSEQKLAPLPLVLLLILTVSPCLILRGLLCTFLVCYRQLEIIRIVSCWTPSQINILICVGHVHVSHQ